MKYNCSTDARYKLMVEVEGDRKPYRYTMIYKKTQVTIIADSSRDANEQAVEILSNEDKNAH